MLEFNKNPIVKIKSQQNPSKNNLTILSKQESKISQPNKKKKNVLDFIKQKKKFIIENSFDIKGTREFLASKEVAMRVIKLNDEIMEDVKKNEEDSDYNDLYDSNLGNDINKKKVHKKISPVPMKDKFNSNKDIYSGLDLKKFKKELKTIKEKIIPKQSDLKIKTKVNRKKSKKMKKDSFDNKVGSTSPKKKSTENLVNMDLTSKKKESSIGFPMHKQTQSQFLFSEINKKLMADDEINLSGIDDRNLSPKEKSKNKLKEAVYLSEINNINIFNDKIKNKINEDIILEEDKFNNRGKENMGIQINSDKESLISILSDLM